MSPEAKSSPPPGALAVLALAALAFALAQTAALIVRPWHHRPGRGPACPDKETP